MSLALNGSPADVIATLKQLVADRDVAGISVQTAYGSPNHTVTPAAGQIPLDAILKDSTPSGLFKLPDGRQAISIDTWASQANRVEAAIKAVAERINYPLFNITGLNIPVTSLDFPHRHADAHWRLLADAPEFASVPLDDIARATVEDAAALLAWFPTSVLCGWWHSQTPPSAKKGEKGKTIAGLDLLVAAGAAETRVRPLMTMTRSSRVLSSEILAKGVTVRQRFAARVDPFGALPGGNDTKYSVLGLGSLPPSVGPKDVTFEQIEGKAFVSLSYLRRFNFGDGDATVNGQVLTTALGLLGLILANQDLHLRSGADLIITGRTAAVEAVGAATQVDLPDVDTLIEVVRTLGVSAGWTGRFDVAATPAYLKLRQIAADKLAENGTKD